MSNAHEDRIHKICAYLRDEGSCLGCPSVEPPHPGYEEYGPVQRGCYGLAEECFNIAVYGTPFVRRLSSGDATT